MATIINPITTIFLNREELASGDFDRFPFKYILEDDGTISYFSKLSGGRFLLSHEATIPGLGKNKTSTPPVAEFQPLAYGNKIPGIMFKQVRQFFLEVMGMGPGTYEAQIFIVWNESSEDYRIIIPKQTVSAAAVKYDIGDILGSDDIIICDIHSHNDMNAFFSGTDDKDDRKNPWISGVFGKLSSSMENKFRFNDGCGRHFPLEVNEVFEMEDTVSIPDEWLKQVTLSKTYASSVRKVTSWNDAYSHVNHSNEDSLSTWAAQYNDDNLGCLGMFDPESVLYDDIVDTLSDATHTECRVILMALKDRQDDPRNVPTLSARESHMFVDIDYTLSQEKSQDIVSRVIDQLIAAY